jgi:ABC-type nickel/cobalt efflux system permease component RcnA
MPVRARAALGVIAALAAALLLWRLGALDTLAAAALALQRDLQGGLARSARALAQGEPVAVWSLVGLSELYGAAHAAGPGHGKALLGAAAVAGAERPLGLAALATVASLAQALTAITVVYGGFALLSLSPTTALRADKTLFAPLGYAAAGLFGLLFAWRGLRALGAGHAHGCGCHPPEAQTAARWRERAALVAAVAARPCGGAMIVLAVAWMAGAPWAGVAGALAMAAGVAAVTAAVALGGFAFRDAALVAGGGARVVRLAGGLQIAAGGALCLFALAGMGLA